MTSLCARCAVRAQRAAASPSTRPFSSTTTRNSHAIPLFTPTPSPELDHVLSELRTKHLIPAAMTNPQRRLIFGTKNREELANNPQSIEIAGEEIQLQWMDRRKEIPNRTKLFDQAMKLMEQDGSRESWSNLPKLLGGFKRNKIHVTEGQMQRVVRKAVDTGNLGSVLACLRAAEDTGMTLQQPAVLKAVILALHKEGQKGGWTKEGLEKALSDSRSVAQLLESEAHGGGHVVREGDLRQDPRVVGVFLELSAVYAWKFQGGEDVDGKVRAYTERLMYNIGGARTLPTETPLPKGQQLPFMMYLPIWHGLHLTREILGADMPNGKLAIEVLEEYCAGLAEYAAAMQRQFPNAPLTGYVGQALIAWRACIRP